jgi:hypothetical protein
MRRQVGHHPREDDLVDAAHAELQDEVVALRTGRASPGPQDWPALHSAPPRLPEPLRRRFRP